MLPLKIGINWMTSLGAEGHSTKRANDNASLAKDFSTEDRCLVAFVTNEINLHMHLLARGIVLLASFILLDDWCAGKRCGTYMLDILEWERNKKSTIEAGETSARLDGAEYDRVLPPTQQL